MSEFYELIRYQIVPPIFLLFFPISSQVLVALSNPSQSFSILTLFSLGTPFAWKVVLSFYAWGFISLKVPSKVFKGPPTPNGYVPLYAANGLQYYFLSLVLFLIFTSFGYQTLCTEIYQDFASIVQVLNLTSMLLCAYLVYKGKNFPETQNDPLQSVDKPLPYLFYRGIELHPRIFDIDVKQWSNCRVGMLGWALLTIVFAKADHDINGFHAGPYVTAFLTNIYLAKFFKWETGYFNTLDITLDRGGFYLCWGCLCWVQVFYTFTSAFMVGHPSKANNFAAFAILIYGLVSITLNYAVDLQKEVFRTNDGKCHIWGKPAKYLDVEYLNHDGKLKKSKLMLSGYWGLARHMNYLMEINLSLSWALPAVGYGITPFAYFIFIIILLVHRTYRDEEKCKQKYGKGFDEYCKRVPYKIIPYVF